MSATAPETMRAAVYVGDKRLEVQDIAVPELGPNDVLTEVDACGVCGSDVHMVLWGWGTPNSVPGHEWSGRVLAVGSEVADWQPGDRVLGGPTSCGECAMCKRGRPSLCKDDGLRARGPGGGRPGAYAQYHVSDARGLIRVPEGMSQGVAALTEPLAVALHGVTQGRVEPGMRVLVTGAGPIGQLTIAALRARGVDDVVVTEIAPARRDKAAAVGATSVLTPDELPDPGFWPTALPPEPFDVVLDCSGNATAVQQGLTQLVPTGTLVLVGAGVKPLRLDPNRILLNELTITGAYCYDATGFADALELLADPAFPSAELAEPETVGLDGLYAAMEGLVSGQIMAKVLVDPHL